LIRADFQSENGDGYAVLYLPTFKSIAAIRQADLDGTIDRLARVAKRVPRRRIENWSMGESFTKREVKVVAMKTHRVAQKPFMRGAGIGSRKTFSTKSATFGSNWQKS